MKDLQGVQLTFQKGALSAFGDGELKILCVFGAIFNRLKLLYSMSFGHWATAKDDSRSELARSTALCGVVESLILLAGELKEAWESIQECYHRSQVSRTLHPKLPANVQEAMKRCGGHFSGTSLTTYLRNNFANHNDAGEMLNVLKALDDPSEHTFYIFPQDNKYFDYATKMRLAAIALHLNLQEWEWDTVIGKMVEIVVQQVYADVHLALNGILAELFTTVTLQREPVTLDGVRNWNEQPGEYFLAIDLAPLP